MRFPGNLRNPQVNNWFPALRNPFSVDPRENVLPQNIFTFCLWIRILFTLPLHYFRTFGKVQALSEAAAVCLAAFVIGTPCKGQPLPRRQALPSRGALARTHVVQCVGYSCPQAPSPAIRVSVAGNPGGMCAHIVPKPRVH